MFFYSGMIIFFSYSSLLVIKPRIFNILIDSSFKNICSENGNIWHVAKFTTSSKFVTYSMIESGTTELIYKDNIQGRHLVAPDPLYFQWMRYMFDQVKHSSGILLGTYLWMLVLVRFDIINIKDFKW